VNSEGEGREKVEKKKGKKKNLCIGANGYYIPRGESRKLSEKKVNPGTGSPDKRGS